MRINPVFGTNLRSGGKRLWAAGAAVVISVAFVLSALILLGSFNRTMEDQAAADAVRADLVISAEALTYAEAQNSAAQDGEPEEPATEAGQRPDQKLAEAVRELEGVVAAEALSYVSGTRCRSTPSATTHIVRPRKVARPN